MSGLCESIILAVMSLSGDDTFCDDIRDESCGDVHHDVLTLMTKTLIRKRTVAYFMTMSLLLDVAIVLLVRSCMGFMAIMR